MCRRRTLFLLPAWLGSVNARGLATTALGGTNAEADWNMSEEVLKK